MKIPSIITKGGVQLLSGLANNNDSILPMTVKDTLSNCAIVATYKQKGGKDDARERAIEEFGTGIVWLFGIPTVKAILNKTIYPLLNLKPDFDLRLMKNQNEFNSVVKNNANEALKKSPNNSALKEMTNVLNGLDKKNSVLSSFTNKDLYKGLFVGKFAISTALSALALTKIIKYKQKTTQERIERELKEKYQQNNNEQNTASLLNKKVENSNVYSIFKGSEKKNNQNVSFGNKLLDLFMYNPIANTSILDGVITTTRLKEARHGERKEVFLKEAFQIFFIYAIAKPTQKFFEWIGNKNHLPIEMDPKVLFDRNVKNSVSNSANYIKEQGLDLMNEKELLNKVYSLAGSDIKNPLIKLLEQNGNISIFKKGGSESLNYLKHIDGKELKQTVNNIVSLNDNIKNIKGIKGFKTFSVLANVAIGALAMGVLQPLVNIGMRKLLNNGDNRNPAIVAQENKMKLQASEVKLK